jgi:gluconolactonase
MKCPWRGVVLLCVCGLVASAAAAEEKKAEKTRKVEVGKLALTVPESWEFREPTSRIRLGEFGIPSAEGDEVETELTIFAFGGQGGGVEANVQRWIGQFQAEGRKQKITRAESPQGRYVIVEVTGTYNRPIDPPIAMQTKPLPNARMLGAIIDLKDQGFYFLKMAGPRKTVDQNAKAFRASFGADESKEEEVGRE